MLDQKNEGINPSELNIKQKIKLVLGSLGVISCINDKTVKLTFADTSGIADRLEGGQAKYTQVPVFFEINGAYLVSLSPQITGDKIKVCMDIIRQNSRIFENVISDFVTADKERTNSMSKEEKESLEGIIKTQGGVLVPNYFKELDGYLEKRSEKYFTEMNFVPTTSEIVNDLSAMLFFRKGMGTNIFLLPYNGEMTDASYSRILKSRKQFFDHNSWTFYFSTNTAASTMRDIEERVKANFQSYNYVFELIEEQAAKKKTKFIVYARSTEPLERSK